MTRRRRDHVSGFADLIWRLYTENESVKHAVTILVVVLAVTASGWMRGRTTNDQLTKIVGWQHQISQRLDDIGR